MITELEDKDILEFLMTSDLHEKYRPEDYKYLIFKFRHFYKLLYGKYQLYKTEKELECKNLGEDVIKLNKEVNESLVENTNLKNTLDQKNLPVKLTLKERFSGTYTPKK
jgi:hypothetical protein